MYQVLLFTHSLFRWLVLLALIHAIIRALSGWRSGRPFGLVDNTTRHVTATIAHIQLLLGLALYFISPIVRNFLDNFSTAVHMREMRFFGMEHSLMMTVGIIVLTIGSMKAKRAGEDQQKFKIMLIWFSVALVIILTSIPWSFSPLTSRPLFRGIS